MTHPRSIADWARELDCSPAEARRAINRLMTAGLISVDEEEKDLLGTHIGSPFQLAAECNGAAAMLDDSPNKRLFEACAKAIDAMCDEIEKLRLLAQKRIGAAGLAPPPKLEALVCEAIRKEVADRIRYRPFKHEDGRSAAAYLQGGAEMHVWHAVMNVMEEAGWRVSPAGERT
jgi:hypothetical protein